MSTLSRAIEIALDAHAGQTDKAGAEYILHPLRVMQRGQNKEEKICGVLHDVIEDSRYSLSDLEQEGFSADILDALRCLTKKPEEEDNYEAFIGRVLQNPLAIQIKMYDLLDNMDLTRHREVSDEDLQRFNKYLKAYWRLRDKSSQN